MGLRRLHGCGIDHYDPHLLKTRNKTFLELVPYVTELKPKPGRHGLVAGVQRDPGFGDPMSDEITQHL